MLYREYQNEHIWHMFKISSPDVRSFYCQPSNKRRGLSWFGHVCHRGALRERWMVVVAGEDRVNHENDLQP